MAGAAEQSEGWLDSDVSDESPEWNGEGEDALFQTMEQQARDRQRQFRGPEKAYEIPKELYEKAEKSNAQLTEEERVLLLSRGDVVGKALAHPESLTLEERYAVLQWSPPEELHAAIRKATGDTLSTPEELYAMACGHQRNLTDPSLSPEAKRILASKFWVDAATEFHFPRMYWNQTPGNWQATQLLYGRAGMDVMFLMSAPFMPRPTTLPVGVPSAVAQQPPGASASGSPSLLVNPPVQAMLSRLPPPSSLFPPIPPHLPQGLGDEVDDGPPKKRTRASRDPVTGTPAWPISYPSELTEPISLFRHDVLEAEGRTDRPVDEQGITQRWEGLGEAGRAGYAARAEQLRGRAWDLVEQVDASLLTGEEDTSHLPGRVDLPGMQDLIARQERQAEGRAAEMRGNMNANNKRPRGPGGPPARETPGYDGQPSWPVHVNPGNFRPFGLFWEAQRAQLRPGDELAAVWGTDDVPGEARRRFDALAEQERAVYESRSEKLRQEVWDEWEEYERRRVAGELVTRPARRQRP